MVTPPDLAALRAMLDNERRLLDAYQAHRDLASPHARQLSREHADAHIALVAAALDALPALLDLADSLATVTRERDEALEREAALRRMLQDDGDFIADMLADEEE